MVWEHYLSRKRQDNLEPSWILRPYTIIKRYLDNPSDSYDDEERFILSETIKSHLQEDGTEVPVKTGFPNEGSRIMHDCWKAGSFTWVFMGRVDSKDALVKGDYVIIDRTLPDNLYDMIDKDMAPQTLYAAYHISDESKNIGPGVYLTDILKKIEETFK
jgi:hypothetical protein